MIYMVASATSCLSPDDAKALALKLLLAACDVSEESMRAERNRERMCRIDREQAIAERAALTPQAPLPDPIRIALDRLDAIKKP